ncbi:hypothetical protein [Selenomonas ruminantium]|uniref:hypothetical protein n=1 Tax=Selenomonas ruminantium TaxID=971 RepID=UPI0026EFAF11|nr:hypothetical protein [Selenomonas ruminantium]
MTQPISKKVDFREDGVTINMNLQKKIVIVSPRQGTGGAIVEHLLCKLLMERGYDAKIFYFESSFTGKNTSAYKTWTQYLSYLRHDTNKLIKSRLFPNAEFLRKGRYKGYNYEPVRGCKRKYLPFVDDDTIVVYSEGIYGNPLKAKNVVRWFLYKNRYPGDYNAYGQDDLFFSYREFFNDYKVNPECRLLKLYNFDFDLYRNYNKTERNGICYIIRKGNKRKDIPKKFDGPIIDDLSEKEIVDVFNNSKYSFSYDTQTFYTTIAAWCGCVSIIVPEEGKSRNDYVGDDDNMYGIAYGESEDELEYAKNTRKLLVEKLNGFKEKNNVSVDNFILECKKKFGR